MKFVTLIYVFCLFYVFIPGNVFKIPLKTSKLNRFLIYSLLFSAIMYVTYDKVDRFFESMENPILSSSPPPYISNKLKSDSN